MEKALKNLLSNDFVQLFSDPSYLFFTLSVFLSQVAFNMLNVVMIFLVFYLTQSNFAVAMLLFALLIPQIIISFFGGVVADRFDKKLILIIGNVLRAGVLLILFFNYQSVFLVYLVMVLVSGITQFYVPAEAPLIPVLVKRDRLVAANSIFGMSFFGSVLIGYVLAGPLVSAMGRGNIFVFMAGIFLAAGLFAGLISQKYVKKEGLETGADKRKSLGIEFKETFSIIKKTGEVGEAFFLLTVSQIIIFILATLIPGYAKDILKIPAEELSTLIFAPAAVGMVLSGLALGTVFKNVSKRKLMNIGIFISGTVLILLPFTSRLDQYSLVALYNSLTPDTIGINIFNFVLVLAFFAGLANALIFIPSQAVIQEVVPENFRSKIYGLLFALIGVVSLVPIIIAGGVADILGVAAVFIFLGVIILLIGITRERIVSSTVKRMLQDDDN